MSKREGHIEVIARGVLSRGRWLLACKNLKAGYYYLPGGHVEFGEAASVALARELMEEAGLRVRVGGLLLATEGTFRTAKREHHELNLVFHVEQFRLRASRDGSPPPSVRSRERHIAFEWLDLRKLDGVDLRPSNMTRWLTAWHRDGAPLNCSTWNSAIEESKAKRSRT